MSAGFTRGPWSVHPTIDHDVLAGTKHIARATMFDSADFPREETFANASLIAAAPDMFAALADLVEAGMGEEDWPQAFAALAKARGDSSIATLPEFGADRAGRASPRAEKSSRPFGDHHGESKEVCAHGVRHPWQCDDCDRENPMPEGWRP